MPLIDLKTNLKSIKFGIGTASDRPGGGYSNQPYIIKDIPPDSSDASNVFNTGGPDSLLRGGLMAPIKSVNDVSRLTQMFFDLKSPNGLLFTAKQNVLSRTSVKTEASIGPGTAGGTVNQGVYLPTSTILQAGVGFTGTHLNLLGLNPFSPGLSNDSLLSQQSNAGLIKYETVAKINNEANSNTSTTTIETTPNSNNKLTAQTTNGSFENRLLDVWYNKQQQKSNDPNVITYSGGPGSILGIGDTNIQFAGQSASERTGINNPLSVSNPSFFYGTTNGRDEEIERNLDNKLKGVTTKSSESSILSPENQELLKNFEYTENNTVNGNKLVEERSSTEISSSVRPIIIDQENSYISNIQTKGSSQKDSNDPSNDPLILDENDQATGQKLSPFTINNDLINKVVPENQIKNYASIRDENVDRTLSGSISNKLGGITTTASAYLPDLSEVGFDDFIVPQRITQHELVLGRGNRSNNEISLATGVNSAGETPKIQYNSILNTPNTLSSKYNSLVSSIGGSPVNNSAFSQGRGFSVYNSANVGESLWPTNTDLQSANNSSTYTQDQIIREAPNYGKLSGQPSIKDFRKTLIDEGSTIVSLAPDYTKFNRETRTGYSRSPGTKNLTTNYTAGQLALDKINASPVYENSTPSHIGDKNDLCKFSIGVLNNDGTGNSQYINFRSFIDSFSDQYSADWGDTQYAGRGDKFYNYKGFTRKISLGWTVYAQSKEELIPMYKKLNFLASSLAPRYGSGGFMQGNLIRLTVGGYLYNQLGVLKGITYDIPSESTWEIGINSAGGYDSSVKELPHMIKVTGFDFIPIEDTIPQFDKSRFIALSTGAESNYEKEDTAGSGGGGGEDAQRTERDADKPPVFENLFSGASDSLSNFFNGSN